MSSQQLVEHVAATHSAKYTATAALAARDAAQLHGHTNELAIRTECRSVFLVSEIQQTKPAFWMLSACQESWGHSIEETWVKEKCIADSSRNLPPVSDVETGRVYKNEYCARCNGIENALTWRYKLACSASLRQMVNQPGFNLTQDLLESECNPCRFVEPQFNLTLSGYPAQPARACYPHVSSCLEKTELEMVMGNVWEQEMYDQVFDQCVNGSYSLVTTIRTTIPLRNHAILCSLQWNQLRSLLLLSTHCR